MEEIKYEVSKISDSEIENPILSELTKRIKERVHIYFPELDYSDISAKEEKIGGQKIIVYHIPYTGDASLLKIRSSIRTYNSSGEIEADPDKKVLIVKIVNGGDDKKIISDFNSIVNILKENTINLKRDLQDYNNDFDNYIDQIISSRIAKIKRTEGIINKLGVRIRK
ncbi:hypothetical protein L0657_06820 [Dyadobacter sp. CY345]|uniref:hypothetical protein n=1 Tax=Dyadobacter sp. CY345 TaxID=2909335 RepID=UPI001F36A272|nr:hypothetical protein [Dyadobacter sp. CY345]MCF2443663.1 hypothetical protein [Dyadobacter sp. CY345]